MKEGDINGYPVFIDKKKEEDLDILLVEISEDKLSAYLTILLPPEGGKMITVEDVVKALKAKGVVYGINEERIQKALKEEEYNKPLLIAEGIPQEPGQDAYIVYNFKTDKKVEFKEENLRIDFKELKLIETVNTGDILLKKIPPTKGNAGITVTGEIIPPKEGKDIKIKAGKNTAISDEEDTLIATCPGKVVLKEGKVDVEPIHIVDKDVDYSTGNIDFPGDVIIRGNVLDGFRVTALGNLEIGGCIEKATVYAKGNLVVKGGILGKGGCTVEVEGYIIARFIENAYVKCKKDIIVDEDIIHSYIDAGGSVYLKGRLGKIIGGKITASKEISARVVGSIAEVETILEVGAPPEIRNQIRELINQINQDKEDFDKLSKEIKLLLDMKAKMKEKFPADKQERLLQNQRMQDLLLEKLKIINDKVKYLQSFLHKESQARISVRDTVYPGCRLVIHTVGLLTRQEYKYVTFRLRTGKIEVVPYQEIKLPQEIRRLIL